MAGTCLPPARPVCPLTSLPIQQTSADLCGRGPHPRSTHYSALDLQSRNITETDQHLHLNAQVSVASSEGWRLWCSKHVQALRQCKRHLHELQSERVILYEEFRYLPSLSSSWTLRYRYSSPLPFLICSIPCSFAMIVVLPEPSSPGQLKDTHANKNHVTARYSLWELYVMEILIVQNST